MKKNVFVRAKVGFTLIELLVVIAIIALLAAILFPVFARARENARRTSCQNNEKQLTLGMMQYIQDYDATYPGFVGYSANNNNGNQPNGLWGNQIFPYVKNLQVYKCPSSGSMSVPINGRPLSQYRADYLMNAMLGAGVQKGQYKLGTSQGLNYGVLESELSQPATTVLFFEGISVYDEFNGTVAPDGNLYLGSYMTYQNGNATAGPGMNGIYAGDDIALFSPIHLSGMNMSFADGHVKWYPQAKLLGLGVATPFCGYQNGTFTSWTHNSDIDFLL